MSRTKVCQFRITLRGVEPPVWRRVEVPATYTLWDLHVAIQDAMGWKDYHLHVFRVQDPKTGEQVEVGIPHEDAFEDSQPVLPGWEHPLRDFFVQPGTAALYEYDFGDGWEHDVVLEETVQRVKGRKYPRCIGGARACPPEDCGGVPGYGRLLSIIFDPGHEEFADTMTWLGGAGAFDPETFKASKVRFDNPRVRWNRAFQAQ
jgi:hypothetical protein